MVGQSALGKMLVGADGICKYLNQENNLCTIYDHRPSICRVDEYYEKHCSREMPRDAFYRENERCCEILRSQLQKDI